MKTEWGGGRCLKRQEPSHAKAGRHEGAWDAGDC